jgi:hypothetical protein
MSRTMARKRQMFATSTFRRQDPRDLRFCRGRDNVKRMHCAYPLCNMTQQLRHKFIAHGVYREKV